MYVLIVGEMGMVLFDEMMVYIVEMCGVEYGDDGVFFGNAFVRVGDVSC